MPKSDSLTPDLGAVAAKTSTIAAEVKFGEILSGLIDRSPYKTNRRPIWEAVGVSPAALSQYVLGKARPRFETLVALADFFGVSLDYLVRGRELPKTIEEERSSVTRFVEWSFRDVQDRLGRNAWITARVGELLAQRVEEAVEAATVTPMGGTLTNEEFMVLEAHSTETLLLTVHLEYDIIDMGGGDMAPGPFLTVVADNLRSNTPRPYRFLVSEEERGNISGGIQAFYRILRELLGVPQDRLRLCEFRIAPYPLVIGSCFYKLDWDAVKEEEPLLSLAISDYVTADGWMAFALNQNVETKSEILMAKEHVPLAVSKYRRMWRESRSF